MAYVYMVRCTDDSLYTGIAKDLNRRMREHYYKKKTGAKYTKSRQIRALEMVWETAEWSHAAKLEALIKRLKKSQKEALILHPEELEERVSSSLRGIEYRTRPELTLEVCLRERVSMNRLEQQLSFLMEIDKQKQIIRQTYLADGSRKEGDAEHAWHMAVMCLILKEYANEPFDVAKTILMLLTHDLVEIDAGDTYAYDAQGNETKKAREQAAAERIYGLLPEDQRDDLRALWDEFEAMETPEARFANMLDKIQPILLTDQAQGKSWKEHGVRRSQILKRNERTHEGSEALWNYIREIIEKNVDAGFIKAEDGE